MGGQGASIKTINALMVTQTFWEICLMDARFMTAYENYTTVAHCDTVYMHTIYIIAVLYLIITWTVLASYMYIRRWGRDRERENKSILLEISILKRSCRWIIRRNRRINPFEWLERIEFFYINTWPENIQIFEIIIVASVMI